MAIGIKFRVFELVNFKSGVPLKGKLRALAQIPNNVLAFDAGNWLLDKDLLL